MRTKKAVPRRKRRSGALDQMAVIEHAEVLRAAKQTLAAGIARQNTVEACQPQSWAEAQRLRDRVVQEENDWRRLERKALLALVELAKGQRTVRSSMEALTFR